MSRTGVAVVALTILVGACNSDGGGPNGDGGLAGAAEGAVDANAGGGDGGSGAAACVAAGGQCVQGVAYCAKVGPGANPGSCLDVGPAMLCCAVNADAGCSEIEASSYDQTCTGDSDCVTVSVGDPCMECVFACGENVGAINASAMAQYKADVAKTPAAVAACGCPLYLHPSKCCRSGQCHADSECLSPDPGDAGAE